MYILWNKISCQRINLTIGNKQNQYRGFDYKMMISNLATEHRNELDRINTEFAEKCDKFNDMEKQMRDAITVMDEDLLRHKSKLSYAENERKRLLNLLDEAITSKEREVEIRVDFENKINGMHSLNRVLDEKYQRAIEEIGMFEHQNFTVKKSIFIRC